MGEKIFTSPPGLRVKYFSTWGEKCFLSPRGLVNIFGPGVKNVF